MQPGELTVPQLCSILERRGVLTAQDRVQAQGLEPVHRAKLEAMREAAEHGGRAMGSIDAIDLVVSMGIPNAATAGTVIGDVVIAEAISFESGLRLMRFVPDLIDRALITTTISRPFALRYGVVPVGVSGETLILGVASPLSADLVDELRRSSKSEITQVICPKSEIRNVIQIALPPPLTSQSPMLPSRASSNAIQAFELPRPRSRLPWIIGGSFAIVIAIGFVILLVVIMTRGGPDEPVEAPAVEAPGEVATTAESPEVAEPPEPDTDGDHPAPVAGGPLHFRVKLLGLPRGAQVRLDGEKLRRKTINVPNDGRQHRIEVKARTFEPWEHVVTATEDMEIEVDLARSRH